MHHDLDARDQKIALLIAGHLRSYETTLPHLMKNLIIPNQADVFIITYDKLANKKSIHDDNLQLPHLVNPEHVRTSFGEYLKVLEIKKEKEYQIVIDPKNEWLNRNTTMFKLIHEGGNLIRDYQEKSKIHYDLIIRTRPDLLINKMIDLRAKFDVGNSLWALNHKPRKFKLSDFMIFGPAGPMFQYLDLYLNLKRLNRKYGTNIWNEHLLNNFFQDHKIKYKIYPLEWKSDFRIVRFNRKHVPNSIYHL